MSRYYYTCAIKALYMMKEFGVRFVVGDQGYYSYEQCLPHTVEHLSNHHTRGKFYVAKESEHIFEPKEGDKDDAGNMWCDFYKNGKITLMQLGGIYSRHIEDKKQIFVRNNKHFFAGEVENE